MGIHRAEQSARIEATPRRCFETITDYDTFCDWQGAVQSVDVLERDGEGRGVVVAYEVSVLAYPVRYTLQYSYEPPLHIRWEFVEGNPVKVIEGEYEFEAEGEVTLATYRLGIDPGIPAPGFMVRRANGVAMRQSVQELKGEAERRSAS